MILARIKTKLNGRFYAEITTSKGQVFKTMSFKKYGMAQKYADEFCRTFVERTDDVPKPLIQE